MKKFSIFFIFLFTTTICRAQQAGHLYIVPYNDTVDIGYICDGVNQNVTFIGWAAVNLEPSATITLDSFTFQVFPQSDTVNFQYLETEHTTLTLSTGAFYGNGPNWAASRVADDTLLVTGYYDGQFNSTAKLIFHAKSSPDLAMYGYALAEIQLGGSYSIGGLQPEEETDTMHDYMNSGEPYHAPSDSIKNGGLLGGDNPVILRSCGGATIDSIYESGDFSEFSFDPFPQLPYTIPGDDSLVLNYEFTPKVVDETGSRHHYLIFHSTNGQYLTWSFEYKVYPAASVSESANASNAIRVFPNPASDELQILGAEAGTIRVFDLLGRERMNVNDDGSGVSLDVSHLERGTYFLRLGGQSTKVEIAR